jgi:hypothetical protein
MKVFVTKTRAVEVADFAEASRAVRAATERIRSEQFHGGDVMQDGQIIARVSYNGRVWPPGRWQVGMQPLYDPFPSTC